MTSHAPHPRSPGPVDVDLAAVSARYQAIFDIHTADIMAAITSSVADVPALVAEVAQLRLTLLRLRLAHVNLQAAARAALAAHREGEADPWAYLADELHGHWPLPPGSEDRSGQ